MPALSLDSILLIVFYMTLKWGVQRQKCYINDSYKNLFDFGHLVAWMEPVIMRVRSWTHEEDAPDSMLQEQFQIAMDATKIRTPELIEACRAVLVDGLPTADVAAKNKIEPSSVYRAIATVKAKWEEICAKEEWTYAPLAFPESMMKVMLEFERDLLARYSAKRGKRVRTKQK